MEVTATKDNLGTLKASHASASSDAAAAAQVDRDVLVKAKADLEAITAEKEALQATHTKALEDAAAKLDEQRSKAAGVEALEKELADLKAENGEHANRLSELEIEILEAKESQDKAEDERGKALSSVKLLEDELARAVEATQQANDDAIARDGEHRQRAADLKQAHNEELKAVIEEQAKVAVQLENLKEELAASLAARELAKADAQTATEGHTRQFSEAEQRHLAKQEELTAQIQKISTDLEVRGLMSSKFA
jgi:chromosome segregation ATPase